MKKYVSLLAALCVCLALHTSLAEEPLHAPLGLSFDMALEDVLCQIYEKAGIVLEICDKDIIHGGPVIFPSLDSAKDQYMTFAGCRMDSLTVTFFSSMESILSISMDTYIPVSTEENRMQFMQELQMLYAYLSQAYGPPSYGLLLLEDKLSDITYKYQMPCQGDGQPDYARIRQAVDLSKPQYPCVLAWEWGNASLIFDMPQSSGEGMARCLVTWQWENDSVPDDTLPPPDVFPMPPAKQDLGL